MKITPIDIAHKSFSRKMVGLDGEEVHDFLKGVSDEMEKLVRERNHLKDTLRDKDLSIQEYKERDELLKSTITTATKMAEKIQVDAEREGKLIVSDAEQKAELIVRDARDSLKKIYTEINELRGMRLQFENNMRALVQSHLTMLDQGQKIMPSPEIDRQQANDASSKQKEESIKARMTEAVNKASINLDL